MRGLPQLGADVAVNYKSEDFVAATKAATGGQGANVVLDMVGGDYIERNYEAAAVEGRIVQIAFQGSPKATVDFRRIMLKRLTHTGSTLRARSVAGQGGDRPRGGAARASAHRVRQGQAGDGQHLPARRGSQGARPHGDERPYREDRPDGAEGHPRFRPEVAVGPPPRRSDGKRSRKTCITPHLPANVVNIEMLAEGPPPRYFSTAWAGWRNWEGVVLRLSRTVIAGVGLFACVLTFALATLPARAVEAVNVPRDAPAIDLTAAVERYRTENDRIQVSAAPGADGIVQRMDVRAREGGTNWAVFALANSGEDQIDRLIVIPHYRMVGSGLLWPDLGASRVVSVTSSGDRPDRQVSATADVFRITLDPGAVMTYVVELRTDKLTQIYLWEPDAYKDKLNSITLYYGIVIGIAGLLALFLTILFVVKGSVMFPAAAALGWAVLVYIGIDFGFWGKVFEMSTVAEGIWRAAGEAILAATLVVFLFAYLNLNRWHVRYAHITIAWIAGLAALVAVALFNPAVASGIARLSLLAVAGLGFALVIYLSLHGYDRAVLLIPTWLLLVVWVIAAGTHRHRLHHQRHRRTGAPWRPRPDRDADRLHRDAACVRRRHHHRHRLRRGAACAGADRRRRHDLGLGCLRRQGVHQPGDRIAPRPQARHA